MNSEETGELTMKREEEKARYKKSGARAKSNCKKYAVSTLLHSAIVYGYLQKSFSSVHSMGSVEMVTEVIVESLLQS